MVWRCFCASDMVISNECEKPISRNVLWKKNALNVTKTVDTVLGPGLNLTWRAVAYFIYLFIYLFIHFPLIFLSGSLFLPLFRIFVSRIFFALTPLEWWIRYDVFCTPRTHKILQNLYNLTAYDWRNGKEFIESGLREMDKMFSNCF
jgi:hypothetical protein